MGKVYGVAVRKGGQGKSTTVSTLARLCALHGARVLVVDLAQPGTTTSSLRDIWPSGEHGAFSGCLVSFKDLPPGVVPAPDAVHRVLDAASLPVHLHSQPSWSGGEVLVLPWDELEGDAAAYLHSERVLEGVIAGLADSVDLTLIDFPADTGPLLTSALMACNSVLVPLAPETPALEGLEATLRLLARVREAGHPIDLAGVVLTRVEPRNKRLKDIVTTLRQSGEVEGEPVGRKLLPFAIKTNEFYEQAFRYGQPIWDRSGNPEHWAGYVLLAEWLLRHAGLGRFTAVRRGPAQLSADTRIFDTSALVVDDAEVRLADYEKAHAALGT